MTLYTYDFQGLTNEILEEMSEVILSTEAEFNEATGFHSFIQNKINTAIRDICLDQDNEWDFQRSEQSQVLLTDGTQEYAVASTVSDIDWNSFYIDYDAALSLPDAVQLTYISWDNYRSRFLVGDKNVVDSADYTKPDFVTRANGRSDVFLISPKADAAYTVKFDAYLAPVDMTAITDIPIIPETCKQVIISRVLYYAYKYREDAESAEQAARDYLTKLRAMRRLLIEQATSMRTD